MCLWDTEQWSRRGTVRLDNRFVRKPCHYTPFCTFDFCTASICYLWKKKTKSNKTCKKCLACQAEKSGPVLAGSSLWSAQTADLGRVGIWEQARHATATIFAPASSWVTWKSPWIPRGPQTLTVVYKAVQSFSRSEAWWIWLVEEG